MSEILTYGSRLVTDAQVTKMGTFTSKGGGLMVQIQLPLDSGLAGIIATHLGNIARMTLEFSSVKPESNPGSGGDKQRELFGGPTAEPAPEDLTHQAGVTHVASTCPACGGVAYMGEDAEDACETCGGTGVVHTAPGVRVAMVACGGCDGSGNTPGPDGLERCLVCQGSGKVAAEVTDDPVGDAAAEFEEDEGESVETEDDQAEEAPAVEESA